MATGDSVGSISCPANSGSGGKDVLKFICCTSVPQPETHEVWNYKEYGVTCELHPTARVGVGAGFVGNFLLITLRQLGVGNLCLEGIIIMEASNGSTLLTS